jgi:FlaA1/EpsC-like NDP-sugar epimerase
MLRSSFLVLARRVDTRTASTDTVVDAVGANRAAALRFHAALEERLGRVRGAFAQWRDTQKRCAVYGGGIHTQALLELSGIDRTAVALIIDDDPAKAGQSLAGIPIVPFQEALSHAIDVIVVSSLASEAIILERLASGSLPSGIELTGIYRDLMKGDDIA